MAETTTHDMEMTREEAGSYLRKIADQLESGQSKIRVPIGNKEVLLSPSAEIDTETTVTERSRRLRKDTEQLALTFKWSPMEDTAESDSETDSSGESGTGSTSEMESERDAGSTNQMESDR